jgi:hypothetical protein
MRAVGWRGGTSEVDDPAGYGIKVTPTDRDRHFEREWAQVVVELEDWPSVVVELSPSFWRSCSELRSEEIGRWLLSQAAAPWAAGQAPGIALRSLGDNRFSARVLGRRQF